MSQKIPKAWKINLIALILYNLVSKSLSANLFCSSYCKPNFCTGTLSNQCTACSPPFILQANNTCTVDPSSGYVLFEDATQITSTTTTTTNCGGYIFIGQLAPSSTVSLRSSGAITFPHYAVRVIAWIIMYNEWNTVLDYFQGILNTTNQAVKQYSNTYSTAQLLCSWSTSNQWYMRLDM